MHLICLVICHSLQINYCLYSSWICWNYVGSVDKKDRLPSYAACKKKSYYHPYFSHSAHCSYLSIYISQKIRLRVVDLEDQFQTTLQAKDINYLIWKFRSIIFIFFLFLQELSNLLLFPHCCCHCKEMKYLDCNLMQKYNSIISTLLE